MQPEVLTTRRLTLDQPREGDVDIITESCQDPVFERFMTLPWPYRRSDADYFIRTFAPEGWMSGDEATWGIRLRDDPDHLIGMISLRLPSAHLGFWLAPDARGHGYMVEAVLRVVEWANESGYTGGETVRWSCVAGNTASAAVARRAGFRYTGEGPSPLPLRDGSRPPAWLGEFAGEPDVSSWPLQTFASGLANPGDHPIK